MSSSAIENHSGTRQRLHVAIIMDGNGRWANARGLPRVAGHQEGAKTVRRVIEAAPDLGIGTLTLFAFSSDNWQRPRAEVAALMKLFRQYLRSECAELAQKGARLTVIGRRDRLPGAVLEAIQEGEALTRCGQRLQVRLAVDYSGRDAILEAARRAAVEAAMAQNHHQKPAFDFTRQRFGQWMADALYADGMPDVDLLIRTGGELRISDFLLWDSAYAELYFTRTMWPDFAAAELAAAVAEFHRRERRFGRVPEAKGA